MSDEPYLAVRKFNDGWKWAMGTQAEVDRKLPDDKFTNGPFPGPGEAIEDAEQKHLGMSFGLMLEPKSE